MTSYMLKRLLVAFPVLIAVTVLAFFFSLAAPGYVVADMTSMESDLMMESVRERAIK